MSKKSRRRNKKLLALAGIIGLGTAMANKKRNASIQANEAKESGFDIPAVVTTPKKKPSKVYQDDIMRGGKGVKVSRIRNPKSTFIESDGSISRGDVSTGKKVGIDTPGIFVNKKGNITAGGKQFYDKNQYRTRNDKPAMLGDSGFTRRKSVMASPDLNTGAFDIGFKKGGRVKGCGIAKKGFGRAMKKGRK